MRGRGHVAQLSLLGGMTLLDAVQADTMIPRWGHAAAYLPSPPTLLIQGGKTDPSSAFTYTSAPNSADLILLPLASSFNTSSPPYTTLAPSTAAPTYAWHTLSPLQQSGTAWSLLSFGGDGSASIAVETNADSAWILAVDPAVPISNFTQQTSGWASEPIRRIYHSASTSPDGSKTIIVGGEKDDGSGQVFGDPYLFELSAGFTALPGLPNGVFHHVTVLLQNGTLLLFAGAYIPPATGTTTVLPLSVIYVLDTTALSPSWATWSIGGNVPTGRRGSTAVLSAAGDKVFIYGGADVGLSQVFADGWMLDLGSMAWTQVAASSSAARYDHSAVAVGGDQVIVFGGYGLSGPADAGTYIFDTSTGQWITCFSPVSGSSGAAATSGTDVQTAGASGPSQTASASGAAASGTGATVLATGSATGGARVGGTHASVATSTKGGTATSTTDAPSGTLSGPVSDRPVLSSSAKVGIVVGLLALLASAVAGVFLCCRRRRQRKAFIAAKTWDQERRVMIETRGLARPYGSREKGGSGLMSDEGTSPADGHFSEKPALVGLGVGAVGAGLANLQRVTKRDQERSQAYAELPDEGVSGGGPATAARNPTRREGRGIRLIGPRGPKTPAQEAEKRAVSPRMNMLGDEDSRTFGVIPEEEEEDWSIQGRRDGKKKGWRSASDILRRGPDDGSDDELLLPPKRVKGGPVPTPSASRSDLDPLEHQQRSREVSASGSRRASDERNFDPAESGETFGVREQSYRLPSVSPSGPLDLAGMLRPPVTANYSDQSLSRSERSARSRGSHVSASPSDMEEGRITFAHLASPQAVSLVPSPDPDAFAPIKRSESFFQKMAAGGIAGLLSATRASSSAKPSAREENIRDPSPMPNLWPIRSRDEGNDADGLLPPVPPSSWRDTLSAPASHARGPSISSLQSARSMRDMVIMQREPTSSSVETEAVIETSTSWEEREGLVEPSTKWVVRHEVGIRTAEEWSPFADPPDTEGSADIAAGFPGPTGDPDPEETTPKGKSARRVSDPTATARLVSPLRPPPRSDSPRLTQPRGSPDAAVLVSHRRPVRDMVSSINKRATLPPACVLSPASQYSPQGTPREVGDSFGMQRAETSRMGIRGSGPGAVGPSSALGSERPATTYEAVKRSPLTVANPDWRKGSG